jgi:predicted enzyme related to lactoylglutathione lyase
VSQVTGKNAEVSSWPKRIYAITLFVEDLDAAKHFYQKVFGLPVEF